MNKLLINVGLCKTNCPENTFIYVLQMTVKNMKYCVLWQKNYKFIYVHMNMFLIRHFKIVDQILNVVNLTMTMYF